MYATCLFCNAPLGANEVIEAFPVGRRLAFDAEKGRLWVVCRKCERWNLTPLEERWEAIEQCERQFAETRRRVSTDNVGLARLAEGLELVRIGRPQRPEMAAWRYGDQFGRRRRRNIVTTGAVVMGVGAVIAGGMAAGIGVGLVTQLGNVYGIVASARRRRTRLRIPLSDGGVVETNLHLVSAAILRAEGDVPVLHTAKVPPGASADTVLGAGVALRGPDAISAARVILPLLNRAGGAERQVRDAVRVLEATPDPVRLYRDAAVEAKRRFESKTTQWGEYGMLRALPAPVRLALEMAAHEETERRALEGELAELERMWKEAEEIAAIADDLLVPNPVQRAMRRLKGKD